MSIFIFLLHCHDLFASWPCRGLSFGIYSQAEQSHCLRVTQVGMRSPRARRRGLFLSASACKLCPPLRALSFCLNALYVLRPFTLS